LSKTYEVDPYVEVDCVQILKPLII